MATLLDLATRLEKRASTLRQEASDSALAVAAVCLEHLVNETPVDSSKALSNWQVRIGTAASGSIDAYYLGTQGSTAAESAANALLVGRAILKGKLPGQAIYLSNTLPYIQRLNDGYSAQAPKGYVEACVLLARTTIKRP